ncbi:hypothetical protein [Sphingobium mellinum]|uniref:hypothetical protein n=1 Tax=Sphingobium mellinum TaxID=1387166 RepID=UPI0030EF0648
MATMSNDADFCLNRSKEETRKAAEAMCRGDQPDAIYIHRELALRYHARAMAAMRPPSIMH